MSDTPAFAEAGRARGSSPRIYIDRYEATRVILSNFRMYPILTKPSRCPYAIFRTYPRQGKGQSSINEPEL